MSEQKTEVKTLEQLQLELLETRATIKALKETQKDTIVITEHKNSILHISVNSDLTKVIKDNAEKLKAFIVSISIEENATKSIQKAEVIRVTQAFKDFCRKAIKTAIENIEQ